MPIYEFQCTDKNCNKVFEKILPMSKSAEDVLCNHCNLATATRIIMTAPNVNIPYQHRADGSVFAYHGIKNPIEGE